MTPGVFNLFEGFRAEQMPPSAMLASETNKGSRRKGNAGRLTHDTGISGIRCKDGPSFPLG
jgi:hypothetical protein